MQYETAEPEYLTLAIEGRRKHEGETMKREYEIARQLAYFMVQPHSKKPISPKKLWAFSWDVQLNYKDEFEKHKDIFDELTRITLSRNDTREVN